MAGYSYFDYDQMTLLGIEVHSDELKLPNQASEEYDWKNQSPNIQKSGSVLYATFLSVLTVRKIQIFALKYDINVDFVRF